MRALIVLSCLLMFATSASAECAWMMWGTTHDGRFLPMRAYTTNAACEQESTRITQAVTNGISKGTTYGAIGRSRGGGAGAVGATGAGAGTG
jgi:hypothetical protein